MAPMQPKQAYAGALSIQPQVVQRNTVLVLHPPSPGAAGTVAINFRNGSASYQIGVGYGQPFAILPLHGRIVGTVSLVSGSVNYYTTTPELAQAFQSVAASPGGDAVVTNVATPAISAGYTELFQVPAGVRYALLRLGIVLDNSDGSAASNLEIFNASGLENSDVNPLWTYAMNDSEAEYFFSAGAGISGTMPDIYINTTGFQQWVAPIVMLPGDVLGLFASASSLGTEITVRWSVLQEPL